LRAIPRWCRRMTPTVIGLAPDRDVLGTSDVHLRYLRSDLR
jgi:hypothetical protein